MLFPSVKDHKSFTLLELIVVIIILGILAAIAVPTFVKTINKAHDSAAATELGALGRKASALSAFDKASGVYDPAAFTSEPIAASAAGSLLLADSVDAVRVTDFTVYPKGTAPATVAAEVAQFVDKSTPDTPGGVGTAPSTTHGDVSIAFSLDLGSANMAMKSRSGNCVYVTANHGTLLSTSILPKNDVPATGCQAYGDGHGGTVIVAGGGGNGTPPGGGGNGTPPGGGGNGTPPGGGGNGTPPGGGGNGTPPGGSTDGSGPGDITPIGVPGEDPHGEPTYQHPSATVNPDSPVQSMTSFDNGESGSHRLYMTNTTGQVLVTVDDSACVGNCRARVTLNLPGHTLGQIDTDNADTLFVADKSGGRILSTNRTGGDFDVVLTGLTNPVGVAFYQCVNNDGTALQRCIFYSDDTGLYVRNLTTGVTSPVVPQTPPPPPFTPPGYVPPANPNTLTYTNSDGTVTDLAKGSYLNAEAPNIAYFTNNADKLLVTKPGSKVYANVSLPNRHDTNPNQYLPYDYTQYYGEPQALPSNCVQAGPGFLRYSYGDPYLSMPLTCNGVGQIQEGNYGLYSGDSGLPVTGNIKSVTKHGDTVYYSDSAGMHRDSPSQALMRAY